MKSNRVALFVFVAVMASNALGRPAVAQCPPLNGTNRAKLIDYVQKKYRTIRGRSARCGGGRLREFHLLP